MVKIQNIWDPEFRRSVMPRSSDSLNFLWDIKKPIKEYKPQTIVNTMRFFQLFVLHFNKNIGEIRFQALIAVNLR